jgi:predicted GNAT family N-acyltransferase
MGASEFVDLIKPLGDRLSIYDPTSLPTSQPKNDALDPAKGVPQNFIDAMQVREEVYVREQKIPLENELDEDDARSFHWVVYASIPAKAATTTNGGVRRTSTSTKIPIGTIRLVPPPHPPHAHTAEGKPHANGNGNGNEGGEAYIKLGRLAVIKEFRKAGISKLLIETALAFAREHPYEVGPQMDLSEALHKGIAMNFKGLVLVHSQVGVVKVWKRYGFEVDEGLGKWMEEGIEHVGMWKRVDVSNGRRNSKLWTQGHSVD